MNKNNPYAPPKSETIPLNTELASASGEEMPMPPSIITVLVLYIVIFLFSLLQLNFVGIVVGILLILGVIKRQALAWQWGRVIPVIYLAFIFISIIFLFPYKDRAGPLTLMIYGVYAILIALLLAIPILLSRKNAKKYFRLRCPKCSSYKVKAASFLFNKRKCRDCQTLWK